MLTIIPPAAAPFPRSRAKRKIVPMTIRIAILAASLIATSAAHAQGSAAPSNSQAAASSLQGQKPWDFLTASPTVTQREVPTTGSVAPRPRRAVDRANR